MLASEKRLQGDSSEGPNTSLVQRSSSRRQPAATAPIDVIVLRLGYLAESAYFTASCAWHVTDVAAAAATGAAVAGNESLVYLPRLAPGNDILIAKSIHVIGLFRRTRPARS